MNWKQILRSSATIQTIVAGFMLIPTLLSFIYGERSSFRAFSITLLLILLYVTALFLIGKSAKSKTLSVRDVYLFVTLTWVVATFFGALPLFIGGAATDYPSAYMEIMSGFSTTGLTTIVNIEAVDRSIIFWRSLTHWLGGMGIVVLFVALLPLVGVEGAQLYSAEATGPTKSRFTPKIKNTALILYLIYVGLTLVQTVLLLFGGLSLFDALTISFGTVATGGFSPKNASIGHYNSGYVDWVVTLFMIMGGINFTLYYSLFKRKFLTIWKNSELKVYLLIILFASLISAFNLFSKGLYATFSQALRFGAFQSVSFITTTGFFSTNYEIWPYLSQAIIFLLMFVGGCSGSTGGGIKVGRIVTVFRLGKQNIKTLLHPKGYFTIQSEQEKIPWKAVNAIVGFIALYISLVLVSTLVVASAGYDIVTSFVSGLTSLGNIGLGMGAVGPKGVGFTAMPSYVKWTLSFMMLAGRLEIYTVLAIFTPTFWRH